MKRTVGIRVIVRFRNSQRVGSEKRIAFVRTRRKSSRTSSLSRHTRRMRRSRGELWTGHMPGRELPPASRGHSSLGRALRMRRPIRRLRLLLRPTRACEQSGDLTRPEEGVCAAVSLLHAAITRPILVFLSLYMGCEAGGEDERLVFVGSMVDGMWKITLGKVVLIVYECIV